LNYFVVLKLLGLLVITVAASMTPSLLWSLYYRDGAQLAILLAMVVSGVAGSIMFVVGRSRPQDLFRREATTVVGVGWLLSALVGALPFYFAGAFPSLVDCYFEAMSGFTTTGASVLIDFDSMAQGLHFWRCFTHWLGGMGIIVLFVAILPFLGAGGRALMKSEVPGPVTESLTPRVKDTAAVLWKLYCILTVAQTFFLMLCGMSFFDALCHTFATLATGGFSTHARSIAGYESLPIEIVTIVFMIAAGTNFSLYYTMLRGNRRALFVDREWRTYVYILAGSTVFVAFLLWWRSPIYESPFRALRDSAFQVVALMTTTGFATANFDLWPGTVKVLLVLLMFVGGCAGSTGGGIKVMRWIILAKAGWGQLERVYSPRTVRKVRLGGEVLDDELKASILTFFFLWMVIFAMGTLMVTFLEGQSLLGDDKHLVTAATAVVATLNNIGPGLGLVGAVENYAFFNPATKLLLTFLMVLGRLELYAILVLFAPRFWRSR